MKRYCAGDKKYPNMEMVFSNDPRSRPIKKNSYFSHRTDNIRVNDNHFIGLTGRIKPRFWCSLLTGVDVPKFKVIPSRLFAI